MKESAGTKQESRDRCFVMLLVSHANDKKTPTCGFVPVCVCVRDHPNPLQPTPHPCEATLAGSSGGNVYADHNTQTHSDKQTLSALGRWFGLWLFSITPTSIHRLPSPSSNFPFFPVFLSVPDQRVA